MRRSAIVWMMSSATSTDAVRLKPDARTTSGGGPEARLDTANSLQPWQFFVLAALGCATGVTFLARGQGVVPVVLLGVLMAATAGVGLAVLRAVRPLVGRADDRTVMIGDRTRAALEREKMLALRAIKELEFDRAMGKVSESDWNEMSTRLRRRAARLMRQLDAGAGYRDQIERDLAKRLGAIAVAPETSAASASPAPQITPTPAAREDAVTLTCQTCATVNDPDARFCKGCGGKL
jgi:hypothetical protein